MQIEEYKELAEVTMAKNFHYDTQNPSEPDIYHHCNAVISATRLLDLVKKKKFYGKDVDVSSTAPSSAVFKRDGDGGENLIHAAIGLCTESAEILENVMRHKYEGTEVDAVNIKEELGDIMWYFAILLRDLDIDFHSTLALNISKLEKRFQGKFSEFRANNRDLEAERELLEETKTQEATSFVDSMFQTTADGGLVPKSGAISMLEDVQLSPAEQQRIKKAMAKLNSEKINIDKSLLDNKFSFSEFSKSFLYLQDGGMDIQSGLIVFVLKTKNELESKFKQLGFSTETIASSIAEVEKGAAVYLVVHDVNKKASDKHPTEILLELSFNQVDSSLSLPKLCTNDNLPLSDKQSQAIKKFLANKNISIL